MGHSAFEFVHPEDLVLTQSRFAEALAKPGEDIYVVCRYRHKDGSWRWLECVGTNRLEESGVRAVVINYRDITDRKRAEERFRLAVEAAPNGMIMVDREGTIVLANSQIEKMFGYRPEELLGEP